jgi:hypothetical protein
MWNFRDTVLSGWSIVRQLPLLRENPEQSLMALNPSAQSVSIFRSLPLSYSAIFLQPINYCIVSAKSSAENVAKLFTKPEKALNFYRYMAAEMHLSLFLNEPQSNKSLAYEYIISKVIELDEQSQADALTIKGIVDIFPNDPLINFWYQYIKAAGEQNQLQYSYRMLASGSILARYCFVSQIYISVACLTSDSEIQGIWLSTAQQSLQDDMINWFQMLSYYMESIKIMQPDHTELLKKNAPRISANSWDI